MAWQTFWALLAYESDLLDFAAFDPELSKQKVIYVYDTRIYNW